MIAASGSGTAAAVIFGVIVVVGLIIWYAIQAAKRNRQWAAATAARLGLEYSPKDLVGLDRLAAPLMRRGSRRDASHVFSGAWQGLGVRMFQYSYTENSAGDQVAGIALDLLTRGSSSSDTRDTSRTYTYTCAAVSLPFVSPSTSVSRESFFRSLGTTPGLDDVALESEDFNRAFELRSADRQFAYYLVDALMMQYLLGLEGKWGFELEGNLLLAFTTPQRRLDQLDPVLPVLKGFVDHVPRFLYGPAPG
jgi:hypothetical protein